MDKLLILSEVHRGDWVPDYDNQDQKKWWGWFEKRASGWVFYGTRYGDTVTFTAVGPRFVQESSESARKFAEQYLPMHLKVLGYK